MATSAATKDLTFSWEGTDRKGKRLKGETTAASAQAVNAILRGQGVVPLRVRKKSKSLFSNGKPIKPMDIAIFTRQLATMLKAGVPLVQSLEISGRGHDNPRMQELLISIKNDIEGGTTLSEALSKHPRQFDDLFVNLVEAGERAGALEDLLDKIATYKEKAEMLKSKIKKALVYPAAVIVVAIVVTAILLLFAVPQFQELFQGFGADLPTFTLMVINISAWLQANVFFVIISVIAFGIAFQQAHRRFYGFRRFVDKASLKLPVIGDILQKAAIARFTRTLATMFNAGVPLVDALESVSGATGNILYAEATMEIRDQVATGQQLQLAMNQTGLFPNMCVQMIAIGEESGAMDEMAGKVAEFYEREVDDKVDSLSSLLEPMIMVIIGVLVGGLVIAMYLPIFKLGAVV